ncbi:hypothetical protein GSI_09265 [Ganoderma sinense ZZ0214-1]|uniref:Uncharacterized protein n=1 Tax=Ganoderma sinense ZZ0214-1 TaxID=1077348 RepID=A0A2G8S615_9APHY|nr:hypothetical protein GSI_09265 [Ganoderma sinense ZZ0214-1]
MLCLWAQLAHSSCIFVPAENRENGGGHAGLTRLVGSSTGGVTTTTCPSRRASSPTRSRPSGNGWPRTSSRVTSSTATADSPSTSSTGPSPSRLATESTPGRRATTSGKTAKPLMSSVMARTKPERDRTSLGSTGATFVCRAGV